MIGLERIRQTRGTIGHFLRCPETSSQIHQDSSINAHHGHIAGCSKRLDKTSRNSKTFSLNVIVDVGLRRRRHELLFWIFLKHLEQAISKFTVASRRVTVFTFRPEITSPATSGQQQIAQTCSFWDIFGSRFLANGSMAIQVVHFLMCKSLDIFAAWPRKWHRAQVDLSLSSHYINGWFRFVFALTLPLPTSSSQ